MQGLWALDADGEDTLDVCGAAGSGNELHIPQLLLAARAQLSKLGSGIIERGEQARCGDDHGVIQRQDADEAILGAVGTQKDGSGLGHRQERKGDAEVGIRHLRDGTADERAWRREADGRRRGGDASGPYPLRQGTHRLLCRLGIWSALDGGPRAVSPLAELLRQGRYGGNQVNRPRR